jgi:hypothetical protein
MFSLVRGTTTHEKFEPSASIRQERERVMKAVIETNLG